jgi:hypothetical protein
MNAAYTSGHVNTGRKLDIPLIDLHSWKEDILDIHNSRQPFSVRARMQAGGANTANQVIWFTHEQSVDGVAQRAVDALSVLDTYLTSGAKPARFEDQCFDASGQLLANGTKVWDGLLNNANAGQCTQNFTVFSSSRMVAGDSYRGDMFKCATKPLATALTDGTYESKVGGSTDPFTLAQKSWLAKIFPNGVCDYSKPDVGRPAGV